MNAIRFHSGLTATVAAVFACGLALSAQAQLSFAPGVTYSTGPRPDGIAAGDFDRDGDNDLAVVTDEQGTGGRERLEIFRNDGSGAFTRVQTLNLPNSSSPNEARAADFDGDGDIDVAVVLEDFNQVILVRNTGGTFSLGPTAPIGSNARGMDAADHDNDGDVDLAVANRDDNTATVLTNNGNGTFAAQTLVAGAEPRAAAFVNINGDSRLDLAVTNHDNRTISLYLGGAGGFTSAGTIAVPNPFRPEGITGVDVDDDGDGDLAVAAEGNGQNRALVYINNGGSFAAPARYPTDGVDTSGILAADFDQDGAPDLVTTNESSANVSVLRNEGSGTFGPPQLLTLPSVPSQAVASDLDGDGDPDLAVTNLLASSFSVFINEAGGGAEIADLIDLQMLDGFIISGGLPQMRTSDDAYFQAEARVTGEAHQTHLLRARIAADADRTSASTLQVTFEGRISDIESQTTLSLRDWNTNQMVEVGQFTIHMQDETHVVNVANATRFLRSSDGRLELEVRQIVLLPFTLNGFHTFIDLIEIEVN